MVLRMAGMKDLNMADMKGQMRAKLLAQMTAEQ